MKTITQKAVFEVGREAAVNATLPIAGLTENALLA